jgi:CBS domain-containing protein
MMIRDVMTENAECTRPDATLHEAAMRMKALDVGALPVCDGDRLVGMLTDRDITIRSVAAGHDPDKHVVAEAMTQDMCYCFDDQNVSDVTRLMKERQIRRVPVLSRTKRLTGIVSLGDLALEIKNDRIVGGTLERISEPSL